MTTRGNPRENRHPLRLHRRATVGAASIAIAFFASTLARPSSASTVSVTVLASTVSIPRHRQYFLYSKRASPIYSSARRRSAGALCNHTTSMGSHELAGTTRRRPLFASRGLASSAPATTVLVAEPAKAVHGLRTWPRAVQGRHPYMAEREPYRARQSRTWPPKPYMGAIRTWPRAIHLASAARSGQCAPAHARTFPTSPRPTSRWSASPLSETPSLSLPRGVHRAARCGARNRPQ